MLSIRIHFSQATKCVNVFKTMSVLKHAGNQQSYKCTQIKAYKCSESGNKWIQDIDWRTQSSHWDAASLFLTLCEYDKHDLVTDEGFVCRYISLCLCYCSEYLYPTSLPLLTSVSLSFRLAVSLQCALTRPLCVCVVLLRVHRMRLLRHADKSIGDDTDSSGKSQTCT